MMLDFTMMRTRIWDRQRGYNREWGMNDNARLYHPGTLKTVGEIYGFEQVIIIGRSEGKPDFVGVHGSNPRAAGFAARLGEYLSHKLGNWRLAEMDRVLAEQKAPPPGAAS